MTLTSGAVLAFFRAFRADRRVWHTVVAPALGLLGLLACLALTVTNFPTLIGGSPAPAAGIGAVLVVAFVVGVVWSLRRPSVLPDPADPATASAA